MSDKATTFTPQPPVFRRIVRGLLVLVLLLALAGFLYENISEARDRRFNPTSGERIDIGGYKMHIDCAGQGSPAAILDSGLGDSYVVWQAVGPQIAKFTRVCAYDRAGLGYSDSGRRPRTSRVMAEELHSLLQAAKIAPPYVLAGHSMGGYDVRLFASLYRSEVAGIVLVDSSHPDQENRFSAALKDWEKSELRTEEFLEFGMPIGIPRLLGLCSSDPVVRAAECNFRTAREGVEERESFQDSAAESAATAALDALPLVVLSRDPDKLLADLPPVDEKQFSDTWKKMQEELAHLSTRGVQIIAKKSGHYIQEDRPDVVVDAVRTVVEQARADESATPPKR